MITLGGYTFQNEKACLICIHIMDGAPILDFMHDLEGHLHFGCGKEHNSSKEWKLVDLEDVVSRFIDYGSLPVVDFGQWAYRDHSGSEWHIGEVD